MVRDDLNFHRCLHCSHYLEKSTLLLHLFCLQGAHIGQILEKSLIPHHINWPLILTSRARLLSLRPCTEPGNWSLAREGSSTVPSRPHARISIARTDLDGTGKWTRPPQVVREIRVEKGRKELARCAITNFRARCACQILRF